MEPALTFDLLGDIFPLDLGYAVTQYLNAGGCIMGWILQHLVVIASIEIVPAMPEGTIVRQKMLDHQKAL